MTQLLNKKVEYIAKANTFLNPLDPKTGILAMGDQGIEFRTDNGKGFIQIPWHMVKLVRVQILFWGKYVRGFFIDSQDGNSFNFVASQARDALPVLQKHLGREKLVQNRNNFKSLRLFPKRAKE